MGDIKHTAIVITGQNKVSIEAAATKARELGLEVLGPSEKVTNGYSSILICPDGSKAGWEKNKLSNLNRASFREWLWAQTNEDRLDWVEIAYGNTDASAVVKAHAWMTPKY